MKEIKRKNLLESGVVAPVKDNVLLAIENKIMLLDTLTDVRTLKSTNSNLNLYFPMDSLE